jgi:hypothetical protein
MFGKASYEWLFFHGKLIEENRGCSMAMLDYQRVTGNYIPSGKLT